MSRPKYKSRMRREGNRWVGRRGRPPYYSNFHVTISTNIRPTTVRSAQHYEGLLETYAGNMFGANNIYNCFSARSTQGTHMPVRFESCDINYRVELGNDPHGRRIHTHIYARTKHSMNDLKINLEYLKRELNRAIPDIRSPFIRVTFIPEPELLNRYQDK